MVFGLGSYHLHTTFSRKKRGWWQSSAKPPTGYGNTMTMKCSDVSAIVEASKQDAVRSINIALLRRNHLIGKRIDEEILSTRANDYGKSIIKKLSVFLTERFGSGFDKSSLYTYVRFYRLFPNIFQTLSGNSFLSWSHYTLLIRVDSDVARPYYEKEALASGWSVRDLQRAIHSQYYERLLSTQSGCILFFRRE